MKATATLSKNRNPTRKEVTTMTLLAPCESSILHEYMEQYKGLLVSMFERLGGLKQLIRKDKKLLKMVDLWNKTSLGIAEAQINDLQIRREAIELQLSEDYSPPKINIPANWELEFVVTHPVAHSMVSLIKRINEEAKANETLYFAGVADDEFMERVKNEVVCILSGLTDRLAKATKPGKRQAQNADRKIYSAIELVNYIRNGFRLEFSDIPQAYVSHVKEYEAQTAEFNTSKEITNTKTQKDEKET